MIKKECYSQDCQFDKGKKALPYHLIDINEQKMKILLQYETCC